VAHVGRARGGPDDEVARFARTGTNVTRTYAYRNVSGHTACAVERRRSNQRREKEMLPRRAGCKRLHDMQLRGNSIRTFVAALCLPLFGTACQLDASTDAATQAVSTNGRAGAMPAFYDDELFTVNMKELPDGASEATIANNKSINEIYAYADLDEEQPFDPIIDAIQGDGFNPLWQQFIIHFTAGNTPVQLTSDTAVDEAVDAGIITLEETDEVYRCSVIGPK
jgi:hypothetical protein